jgi:signal peptidase II
MKALFTRLSLVAYVLAVVIIGLDQWTKQWAVAALGMDEGASQPWLGPLHLSMVHNKGFSFGFLNGGSDWARWGLTVFSIAVAGVVAVWVRRVERPLLALAAGLVIGGAVGNVIDRVRLGWVIDFIDVSRIGFPWVFNVADAAINVGVALLILETFVAPRKRTPP